MKVMWIVWATSLWALARAAPAPQNFNAELIAGEGVPFGHRVTSITHAEPLSQIVSQSPNANTPLDLDDILHQLTQNGGSIVSADFIQGPTNPSFGSPNPVTSSFTHLQQNEINRQGSLGSDELFPLPDSREINIDDSTESSDELRIVNIGGGFSSPGDSFGGGFSTPGNSFGGGFSSPGDSFGGGSVTLGGSGVTLGGGDFSLGGSTLVASGPSFSSSGGGLTLGGGGVSLGGGEFSLGGSAVSSGPSDSYSVPPSTLGTPSNDYLPPPSTVVTASSSVVTAPAKTVVVSSAKPALVTSAKPALPIITKPTITFPPKPIVQLPPFPTISKPQLPLPAFPTISKPQLPLPTLSTNALGALLGGLANKAINPTQTLGSLLRGLNGQDGIVVVDLNSKEDSNVRIDTDDLNDNLDNFDIDIDSIEDDTFRFSTGGVGTLSFDTPTTTAVTATTKAPLGPKFLFQGPLSDILLTKGQWLGTLLGGLVDIGGVVVRSFSQTPLF